jgi:HD-GYP domain-containing protein (c-di-GMP phosphodiesterase class II)
VKDHAETSSLLNDMVRSAAQGKPLNGGDIATVVSGYLAHLTLDSDCVVDVVNAASGYARLAEQALNTSLLGMSLAIEMGMDEETVRLTGLCGLLHDWGMTRISAGIRDAPRILSQAEFTEIQKHPIHTLEMLQRITGIPSQVPLICYQIHEQPNGRGYPRGRRNKQIHPCAGILRVADAFNALTSPRPYRSALMPYAALECLLRNAAERVYDPEIVRSLLHVTSLFPIGSSIALNDGCIARVIRRNGNNFANPIVQIVQNRDGSPLTRFQVLDMSQEKRKIVRAIPTPGRSEVALSPEVVVRRRD